MDIDKLNMLMLYSLEDLEFSQDIINGDISVNDKRVKDVKDNVGKNAKMLLSFLGDEIGITEDAVDEDKDIIETDDSDRVFDGDDDGWEDFVNDGIDEQDKSDETRDDYTETESYEGYNNMEYDNESSDSNINGVEDSDFDDEGVEKDGEIDIYDDSGLDRYSNDGIEENEDDDEYIDDSTDDDDSGYFGDETEYIEDRDSLDNEFETWYDSDDEDGSNLDDDVSENNIIMTEAENVVYKSMRPLIKDDKQTNKADIDRLKGKKIDYSKLRVDQLYRLVSYFVEKQKLNIGPISANILDSKFGKNNILKLVKNQYLLIKGAKYILGTGV